MFKIGDYVTRKKYGNDIIFKIVKLENKKAYLYGKDYRLCADSNIDDLVLSTIRKDEEEEKEIELKKENNFFYIPGTVLHIDADKEYLIKCEKYYKKHHINYYGYVFNEKDFKYKINNLIKKHNPDIIVLTGHDAYYKNKEYKNSKYFIETVKEIRDNYDKSIVIISGACQSDFYNLIKNGSTFASSPNHINIHALDPAIIASNIALYSEKEDVNLKELLNKTKYGPDGIGGINTKGKMKSGYPRINNKK